MQMGYPWVLKEFHIPANIQYQRDIANKYASVIHHAKEDIMPTPCCATGSKQARTCPARAVCPVALS